MYLLVTGKTTSLQVALSLCGVNNIHFKGGRSTISSLLCRAAVTTMPIGVDDISSEVNVENLTVQFFNGAGHTTAKRGSVYPCTSLLLTANKHFAESER